MNEIKLNVMKLTLLIYLLVYLFIYLFIYSFIHYVIIFFNHFFHYFPVFITGVTEIFRYLSAGKFKGKQ